MSTLRALVIDDEKSLRKTMRRALEDMGFDVETAASGEEGLAKSRAGAFSVIMLDLRMPGMEGLEVLRQVKADNPATPVVIISAHGTVDSAVAAMRLGAVDFLQKPFSLEEVRGIVGEVLERCDLQEGSLDYDSLVGLAKGAFSRREFDLAETLATRAIATETTRPEAYNLLGYIHEIRGDKDGAMKFYRASLDMDPTYAPARANFNRQ